MHPEKSQKVKRRTSKGLTFNLQPLSFSLRLPSAYCLVLTACCLLLFSSACMVGPNYHRPTAPVPPAYKEAPPPGSSAADQWKPAQPNDSAARGKWWEIYNDPRLNALEEQVNISNQNVLAAEAQFREARDAVRIARSNLFPTITTNPSYTNSRTSATLFNVRAGNLSSGTRSVYDLPVTVTYLADIWGSIRRNVGASADTAQASFAQLQNARLSFQAELAQDYFGLHGTDGQEELLQRTVKSYQEYLQLTKDRMASGVASGGDVAQAETQLYTTQAQLVDLGVARAQFEHAIAVLVGKPPSEFSLPSEAIKSPPPPIPVGIPSTLLERRPDIATAERQMAAQNEQIGIAKAAYYPSLTLSATGGFQTGQFTKWLNAASGFWSLGPQFAQILFDAGRRRAQIQQAQAGYDATADNYRQTVLAAFQQVDDNLAALRILANESEAQNEAVKAAQQFLDISTYQYKAGTVNYLQVLIAQTTALQDQVTAVNILTRRMNASVLLIEALGGGWNASTLPSPQELVHGK